MNPRAVRVMKVGGSLLDFPDLATALRRFVSRQDPAVTVVLCGGGPWADAVRDVSRQQPIDAATAHWLAVRAMGITTRLLAALVPEWTVEACWERLETWIQCAHPDEAVRLLDAEQFLRDVEPRLPGPVLPHNWDATSDSIAARIAIALRADNLVLLKSALPPDSETLTELADQGYVDPHFPPAARGLESVRMVHLRDPHFREAMYALGVRVHGPLRLGRMGPNRKC